MGKKKKNRKSGTAISSTLSLCMIVKNEEEYLRQCLNSIKSIVSEIIIVDTGSADATKDIAAGFGAKVYDFKWNDSFSEARNYAIGKAASDWIIMLDADEYIDKKNKKKLSSLLKNPKEIAYNLHFRSPVKGNAAGSVIINTHPRLFKNNSGVSFRGRIHEQIIQSVLKAGGKIGQTDIIIEHKGYAEDVMESRGKIERNITLLTTEVRDDPANSFAWFNLGEAYSLKMDWPKAVEAYLNALSADPLPDVNRAILFQNLGTALLHSGRFTEALDNSDTALSIVPSLTAPHLVKAEAASALQRYDLAIQELQRLIGKYGNPDSLADIVLRYEPDWGQIYLKLAENARMLNKADMAKNAYEQALKYRKNDALSLLWLGRIAILEQNAEPALEYFTKAASSHPREIVFPIETARLYEQTGRREDALKSYKKALEIDPSNSEALFKTKSISENNSSPETNAEILLSVQPDRSLINDFVQTANILLQSGKTELADQLIGRGLTAEPDHPSLLYLQALISDFNGDIDGVIEKCRHILSLYPDLTQVIFLLGNKYLAKQEFDCAIEQYKNADRIEPDIREVLFNLAVAYIRKNELAEAQKYFQRIVLKHPDDEVAKKKLEAINLKMKRERNGNQ